MQINTTITMGAGEKITDLKADNAQELAGEIMSAVGGDPEKDTCIVQIMGTGTVGMMAGPMPTPVAAPTAPVEEPAKKTTKKG